MALHTCTDNAKSSSSSRSIVDPQHIGKLNAAALAQVSAFLPLAASISSCSKPLLHHQQQLTVTALLPHIDSLAKVVTAAPAVLAAVSQQEQLQQLPALAYVETLVLLGLWMLHSYTAAIHDQHEQQQQQTQHGETTAPASAAGSWEHALVALAALLADDIASQNLPQGTTHLHMQTAALQLARCLLTHQRAGRSAAFSQLAACSGAWRDVVAAVVELMTRSAMQPLSSSMTKRQLVLCACKLVGDIARQAPQLLLETPNLTASSNSSSSSSSSVFAAAGPAEIGCSNRCSAAGSSSSLPIGQQLPAVLHALLGALRGRNLERSSSGQELFDAAEDALAAVEQTMLRQK
jgi:hypothetical protein